MITYCSIFQISSAGKSLGRFDQQCRGDVHAQDPQQGWLRDPFGGKSLGSLSVDEPFARHAKGIDAQPSNQCVVRLTSLRSYQSRRFQYGEDVQSIRCVFPIEIGQYIVHAWLGQTITSHWHHRQRSASGRNHQRNAAIRISNENLPVAADSLHENAKIGCSDDYRIGR